ncbi:hypothetical protein M409DRAFT_53842 [Zasmidium cellare ATCC 36951]|uniref:Ketoreductase (KR) domain-containing protein n=1 Tax=Zasmidium cellare ATCC 36951 TaxID=1080233 RepID=A0A6A6CPZ0_ZASCE|nr:uncharacterized protein M409DRAFT_53842 [Zasmidium cellare ATCC 36951]KAF2167892.1 hypothetical protein M409DRAFT_53842 [Zasmidium cellare ATCC 36951]
MHTPILSPFLLVTAVLAIPAPLPTAEDPPPCAENTTTSCCVTSGGCDSLNILGGSCLLDGVSLLSILNNNCPAGNTFCCQNTQSGEININLGCTPVYSCLSCDDEALAGDVTFASISSNIHQSMASFISDSSHRIPNPAASISGSRRNQPWMLAPISEDGEPYSPTNRGKAPRVTFVDLPIRRRRNGTDGDDGQVEGEYDAKYRPTQYVWYLWDPVCAFTLHLFGRSTAASRIDRSAKMTGKNVLITGCGGDGILGMEMAKAMAEAGATVWLACPTEEEGQLAKKEIMDYLSPTNQLEKAFVDKPSTGNLLQDLRRDSTAEALKHPKSKINPMVLDLTSDESIRKFCDEDVPCYIDVVVHHANITAHRRQDRFGSMYLTNVLGPFTLSCRLEKMLSPGARVIFANSFIHYFGSLAEGRTQIQNLGEDSCPTWLLIKIVLWSWWWNPLADTARAIFWLPLKTTLFTLSRLLPGPANGIGRLENFRAYATMKQMQLAMVTLLAERWNDNPINDMFAPEYAPPPRKPIHMQAPLTIRNKKFLVHAYNTGVPKEWFLKNMRERPTPFFYEPA